MSLRYFSIGSLCILLIGCSTSPSFLAPQSSERSDVGSAPPSQVSHLKSEVSLPLPFTSQAPYAHWDELHEETCEEASLLMVHHILSALPLNPDIAERELQELVAWETQHGYGYDVTVTELGDIAEEKYGYRATIEADPSADLIREILASGRFVIAPMAGRQLGNPYFTGEGPWYHMLVIRGYRETWLGKKIFITNDPGTRRGEGYEYSEDVIMDSLHDWTGVKEEIATGAKRILVIEK